MRANYTTSSPAMVIGIGSFGKSIIDQASTIYSGSDNNLELITKYLSLGKSGDSPNYDLLPAGSISLNQSSRIELPDSHSAKERQAFIEELVKSADQIRSSMNAAFHEIRAHEHMIRIDMDRDLVKPVNLFLVADLVNPFTAAALLPLAFLLSDICKTSPNTQGYLLLNVAVFPDKNGRNNKDEAALYAALKSLNQAYKDVSNKENRDLLSAMEVKEKAPLELPVYLFDYRKPNYNDVKDNNELQVIFVNSLVALMSGDLASRLDNDRPMGYIREKEAYFHSIGASNLIYDPRSLSDLCANFYAQELLTKGFLGTKTKVYNHSELADQLFHHLGSVKDWYTQLLSETSNNMGFSENGFPCVAANNNVFSLSPINFEDIKATPWVKEITIFNSEFLEERLPEIQEKIQEEAKRISDEKAHRISDFLDDQINNPGIYPGGVNTILSLIELMLETIQERLTDINQQEEQLLHTNHEKSLSNHLDEIQSILDKAPDLPVFWKYVPKLLRKPVSILINLRWIIENYFMLERYKTKINKLLSELHSAKVEKGLVKDLANSLLVIRQQLNDYQEKVFDFEKVLITAESSLTPNWESVEFPLGDDQYHWNNTFRIPAVDKIFAHWAYDKYQQPIELIVSRLIEKRKLFNAWQQLTPEEMKDQLISVSKNLFDKPLRKISLDQVLEKQFENMKEQCGDPTEVSFDPISPLIRAALPLMRPNFDALGGSEYSSEKRFLQSKDNQGTFTQPVLQSNRRMSFNPISNPHIISAVTTRNLMPLEAFSEMNEYLRPAYEKLTKSQKKRLENVFVPIPKLEGEDLIERSFSWVYGEPEESFQICLPISQNRYKHARQEIRLPQSEWIKYVLAESPELNYLSACFLNIFLQHPQWNSFEQTSAILAFVQQTIAYAYDKDTTPKEEWPRYPIETLQEEVGDCEDVAILTAAIMNRLGFQVALLMLPGHCALGIAGVDNLPGAYIKDSATGKHYYYAEATGNGWRIGVLPEKYQKSDIQILTGERLIKQ
jgi:predicted transglutaminase-like cysteine proteinase